MKNIMKNKKILLVLTIILGLGISLSAVYYIYYKKDSRTSSITSGLISIDFKEKSNVILSSNVPVIDDVGLEGTPYEFSVENTSRVPIKGIIKLNVISNTIPLGAVRYGIYINDELVKKDYVHDNKVLYEIEEILVNEKLECKIYFWVDYYYDQPNKTFEAKIVVEGENIDIAYKEATFLDGSIFNYKIKELAGTDTSHQTYRHNTPNYNIVSIQRGKQLPSNMSLTDENILSTNDSEVPIYGWFSNGVLYYYSSASILYTNNYAGNMFRGLHKVESIDLRSVNTNKSYNLSSMFFYSEKIKSLDLSGFDTTNTTNISSMFNMYEDNLSLTSLNISSFDLSKVTNATNIINKLPNLKKFKTPKTYPNDSNVVITLPKTMYDEQGNSYTTLNNTSPTETWLYDEPVL